MKDLLKRYIRDRSGNFAMVSALTAIPMLLGVGIAIDMSELQKKKVELRNAAETAAIASASSFNSTDQARLTRAKLALNENLNWSQENLRSLNMNVELTSSTSTVEASANMPTKLMGLLGKDRLTVSVNVAAESVFKPACVLVNSPTQDRAIHFQGFPKLETSDCYMHSNSTGAESALARGNPSLSLADVCLNGGFNGPKWQPGPHTQCGTKPDPYMGIFEPMIPPCSPKIKGFKTGDTLNISPGNFCGGLKVPTNSTLKLEPGIYVISDGGLELGANAIIQGDGIMFYLTGDRSHFALHSGGTWDITPPTDGHYRGIVIFQDRDVTPKLKNQITAAGSLDILGVIYAKNSELELLGSPNVTMTGAGTFMVVNTLSMTGSPELNIQSVDNPDLRPNDVLLGRDAYIRVIH